MDSSRVDDATIADATSLLEQGVLVFFRFMQHVLGSAYATDVSCVSCCQLVDIRRPAHVCLSCVCVSLLSANSSCVHKWRAGACALGDCMSTCAHSSCLREP